VSRNYAQSGRPLSGTLSRIILTAEEENRQILTVADFRQFYEISDGYARKMIADLVERGWLVRVARGHYQLQSAKTGLDPIPMGEKFVVAGQYAPEGFIAYGSAAEYHGLTNQVFQTVLVATPRPRKSLTISTTRVRFVRIKPENLIGTQPLRKGPSVMVATIERTIIDAIDRPDLCGGISDLPEILRRARSKAQVGRLIEFLPSYHSKSLVQRVGYLLEAFGYPVSEEERMKMRGWCKGSTAYLFPKLQVGSSDHKTFSGEWNLVINAPGFTPDSNPVKP